MSIDPTKELVPSDGDFYIGFVREVPSEGKPGVIQAMHYHPAGEGDLQSYTGEQKTVPYYGGEADFDAGKYVSFEVSRADDGSLVATEIAPHTLNNDTHIKPFVINTGDIAEHGQLSRVGRNDGRPI